MAETSRIEPAPAIEEAKRYVPGRRKPVIGCYGVTGCYGCLLSVIFNEDDILDLIDAVDLKSFPFIKEHNPEHIHYDVILVEGLVAKQEDIDQLREWRRRCTYLVALGACAHSGGIPAIRNFIDRGRYEHLEFDKSIRLADTDAAPIDAYVHVDATLPGCPPSKREILTFITEFARGKLHRPYLNPVCIECRLNQNRCLLEDGRLCLGPITAGGCDAICTNAGLECWGCRGPSRDARHEAFFGLLKSKGFDAETVRTRLQSFVGLKTPSIQVIGHEVPHG